MRTGSRQDSASRPGGAQWQSTVAGPAPARYNVAMLRPDLPNLVAVACGGALGSCARLALQGWIPRPWGTLGVNVLGCFAMGVLLALDVHVRVKAFVAIGLLGGFTTFSGLAADVWWAWHEGARATLAPYLLGSLVGGVLALASGVGVARALATLAS